MLTPDLREFQQDEFIRPHDRRKDVFAEDGVEDVKPAVHQLPGVAGVEYLLFFGYSVFLDGPLGDRRGLLSNTSIFTANTMANAFTKKSYGIQYLNANLPIFLPFWSIVRHFPTIAVVINMFRLLDFLTDAMVECNGCEHQCTQSSKEPNCIVHQVM